MDITVYSTSSCAICHSLMKWLESKGVAYTNIITDEVPDGIEQLLSVSDGAIGVPFTTIKKDDGSVVKISGFDQSKFTQALAI